jgi:aryl-alcohol dehydrogenase-like predicted oxidoreductase
LNRLILGCGNFGGIGSAPAFFGQGESEEEAFALMDAAWELGLTRFDTADAYGGGRSETWIGRWMADRGLARDRILRQIEGSLERLGIERVDTYMIHEPDPDTPVAQTVQALAELLDAGHIGAIGASNVDRAWLEEALAVAPVSAVQNSYSLLDRDAEREMLPFCAERGIAFSVFGPLEGGWLAGKYRRGEPPPAGSRMTLRPEPYRHLDDDAVYDGLGRFAEAASNRRVDMPTLALAWILSDRRVASVVVGPRRPEHLDPAVAALDLPLSEPERDQLASFFP